jgi:hypothetical protein
MYMVHGGVWKHVCMKVKALNIISAVRRFRPIVTALPAETDVTDIYVFIYIYIYAIYTSQVQGPLLEEQMVWQYVCTYVCLHACMYLFMYVHCIIIDGHCYFEHCNELNTVMN